MSSDDSKAYTIVFRDTQVSIEAMTIHREAPG